MLTELSPAPELKKNAHGPFPKRMIDLALAGLAAGVPRMTREEITAYPGRNSCDNHQN